MTLSNLWKAGPDIRRSRDALLYCCFVEIMLDFFLILLPLLVSVPDNLFLYLMFSYFHFITWIMGIAVSCSINNVGYFVMYIMACLINIIFSIIFFSIVTNNIHDCAVHGFDVCDYDPNVLIPVYFIIMAFFFLEIAQFILGCIIMTLARRHELRIIMTLRAITVSHPELMKESIIQTYMDEPDLLKKARLSVEFFSLADFWISVCLFVLCILDLSPTVTLKWIFFVFIGHVFSGVMGLAIGAGIESVPYIDIFVIVHFIMVVAQLCGIVLMIIVLQLECYYCSYVLYIISWIQVAIGMLFIVWKRAQNKKVNI